jgi:hypothetical protein
MFFKFIAAAAIVATPVLAHAQSTTTPTVPQDTTSRTHIHTDSTTVDTSNGSVYTTKKKSDKKTDSTKTDTTMNVSPVDSTKMGVPPARPTPTPPTE